MLASRRQCKSGSRPTLGRIAIGKCISYSAAVSANAVPVVAVLMPRRCHTVAVSQQQREQVRASNMNEIRRMCKAVSNDDDELAEVSSALLGQ